MAAAKGTAMDSTGTVLRELVLSRSLGVLSDLITNFQSVRFLICFKTNQSVKVLNLSLCFNGIDLLHSIISVRFRQLVSVEHYVAMEQHEQVRTPLGMGIFRKEYLSRCPNHEGGLHVRLQ